MNDRTEYARRKLAEVSLADERLTALRAYRSTLTGRIDAAERTHSETAAPLQIELDDPSTSTERRIAARAAVLAANGELKAVVDATKPLLVACDLEIEKARAATVQRTIIENDYCLSQPEDIIRKRIADNCEIALKNAEVPWRDKAANAAALLASERQRRESGRGSYDLNELETQATISAGVAAKLAAAINTVRAEIDAIRKARLAELYA